MLESCHANQGAHVEASHAGMMREEVDTFALNMNTCPDGMMSMQQTPVKGSPGEAYDHQQFKTPSANPSHLLHWQHLKTPTSSGSRHHRTPRSQPHHDTCKVCVLFHVHIIFLIRPYSEYIFINMSILLKAEYRDKYTAKSWVCTSTRAFQ